MYLISKVLFTDFSSNEGQTAAKEYFKPNYRPSEGVIGMAIIPGITLEQKWDSLVNEAKSQSAFNCGISSQRFERSLAYRVWDTLPVCRGWLFIPGPDAGRSTSASSTTFERLRFACENIRAVSLPRRKSVRESTTGYATPFRELGIHACRYCAAQYSRRRAEQDRKSVV